MPDLFLNIENFCIREISRVNTDSVFSSAGRRGAFLDFLLDEGVPEAHVVHKIIIIGGAIGRIAHVLLPPERDERNNIWGYCLQLHLIFVGSQQFTEDFVLNLNRCITAAGIGNEV